MKDLNFYIVDVFAEEKYAGNQLAVFLDTAGLSGSEMQVLAREMHYSETTFIDSAEERNGGYDVRIFTPEEEVPFAGHPTIGTAFVINEYIRQIPAENIMLNLKIGQIPVKIDKDSGIYWMTQKEPEFGEVFSAETTAKILSLDVSDIDDRYPIQTVSTGLPFIIVPLRSMAAVKRSKVNYAHYPQLIHKSDAKAFLIFSSETYSDKNDLNARMYGDYYGVPEDPATGSANGCLAGYLSKYKYFKNSKIDVIVEQGFEIKRPSLLYLKAEQKVKGIQVEVGGKIMAVAGGKLL